MGDRKTFERKPSRSSIDMRKDAASHLSNLENLTRRISTIEEKLIGEDKEVMDMVRILKSQEEKYGKNMYDAIDPNDPMIAEYLALGMTKEQAILKVFEYKFGKVEIAMKKDIKDIKDNDPMVEEYISLGLSRDEAILKVFEYRYGKVEMPKKKLPAAEPPAPAPAPAPEGPVKQESDKTEEPAKDATDEGDAAAPVRRTSLVADRLAMFSKTSSSQNTISPKSGEDNSGSTRAADPAGRRRSLVKERSDMFGAKTAILTPEQLAARQQQQSKQSQLEKQQKEEQLRKAKERIEAQEKERNEYLLAEAEKQEQLKREREEELERERLLREEEQKRADEEEKRKRDEAARQAELEREYEERRRSAMEKKKIQTEEDMLLEHQRRLHSRRLQGESLKMCELRLEKERLIMEKNFQQVLLQEEKIAQLEIEEMEHKRAEEEAAIDAMKRERAEAEYRRRRAEEEERLQQQRLAEEEEEEIRRMEELQQMQQRNTLSRRQTPRTPLPPPAPEQETDHDGHLTVEQRLIGMKKDPDQEALEHGMLLSLQESEYGVNMYDSLVPDDEITIEDYQSQGFTREEAILLIFESKYGKTSMQPKYITPAMPTLHSVNVSDTGSVISGVNSRAGEPDWTEDDEEEIESFMAKGYTREQAVSVYLAKLKSDRRAAAAQNGPPGFDNGSPPLSARSGNSGNGNVGIGMRSRAEEESVVDLCAIAGIPYIDDNYVFNDEDVAEMEYLVSRGYSEEEATIQYVNKVNNAAKQALAVWQEEQRQAEAQMRRASLRRGHSERLRSHDAPPRQPLPQQFSAEDIAEIEFLMSRGYNQEQATTFYLSKRNGGVSSGVSSGSSVASSGSTRRPSMQKSYSTMGGGDYGHHPQGSSAVSPASRARTITRQSSSSLAASRPPAASPQSGYAYQQQQHQPSPYGHGTPPPPPPSGGHYGSPAAGGHYGHQQPQYGNIGSTGQSPYSPAPAGGRAPLQRAQSQQYQQPQQRAQTQQYQQSQQYQQQYGRGGTY